jgi:hypothetical protein
MAKVVASRFALLRVEGEDDNKTDQTAQKSNNAQTNKKKNKKKKGGQDEEVGMMFYLVDNRNTLKVTEKLELHCRPPIRSQECNALF